VIEINSSHWIILVSGGLLPADFQWFEMGR